MTDFSTLKREYYSLYSDLFLDVLKNREMVFMNSKSVIIRGMLIKKKKDIFYYMKLHNFYKSDFNIYMSKCVYTDNQNRLSDDYNCRKKELRTFLKTNVNYVDILYDFDKFAKNEIMKLNNYLSVNSISHYLCSSGDNFHIVISGKSIFEYLKNKKLSVKDKYNISAEMTKKIIEKLNLKNVDKCSPFLRIMKVPYSLVHKGDKLKLCVVFSNSTYLKNIDREYNTIRDFKDLQKLIIKQLYFYNKDITIFRTYTLKAKQKTLKEILKC